MRARAVQPAHVESERTNICSGATFDVEARRGTLSAGQLKFEDFHLRRFEVHGLIFSRQLMRGAAANFLRGIRGRNLLNFSQKLHGVRGDFRGVQNWSGVGAERFAVCVVGVGFKAKTHGAAVALAAAGIKPCEARGAAEGEDQDTSCQRVESAQMADAPEPDDTPHRLDNIVRSFPRRFVDHNNPIEGRRFGRTRHKLLEFGQRPSSDMTSHECCGNSSMRGENALPEPTKPPRFLLCAAGFRCDFRFPRSGRA
jgi:hypothetical protein